VTFDGQLNNPLLPGGQINAILPPSISGGATVVVKNGFGESSVGTQIVIH
jgi:hypothetical protein